MDWKLLRQAVTPTKSTLIMIAGMLAFMGVAIGLALVLILAFIYACDKLFGEWSLTVQWTLASIPWIYWLVIEPIVEKYQRLAAEKNRG